MKKVIKYIGIMFAFIFGLFLVGNNNIKAYNFENSKVEYSTRQILYYKEQWGSTYTLQIYYAYLEYTVVETEVGDSISFHKECTFTNNIISCTKLDVLYSAMNPNTYTNYTYEFVINVDSVVEKRNGNTLRTYTIDTTMHQQGVNNYCAENTCLSNEQYTDNINSAKQEGYADGYTNGYTDGSNGVDVTIDNQAYADKYIQDNNYHTNEDYLNYGNTKYAEGEQAGYIKGQYSVDITIDNQYYTDKYIQDNNYHTNEDYLNYGDTKYTEGEEVGFINGQNSVDITTDNQTYADQYITDNNYHTNEDYLNYGSEKSAEGYTQGRTDGKTEGYQKANNDGKILGGFIPSLLGGFGSFFLTIMNINILGFNLLDLFGILISIGTIIIIIKFLRG